MKTRKTLNKIIVSTLSIIMVLMPLGPVLAEESTLQTVEPPPVVQEPSQQVSEPAAPVPPSENFVTPPPTVTPPPSIQDPVLSSDQSQATQANMQSAQSPGSNSSSSGNVGDTALATGDGSNTTNISNNGNTNTATLPCCVNGSATVVNSGNGAGSNNSGSATTTSNSNTGQVNGAVVGNNVNSSTVTGDNATSYNVGDSSLSTGDANTTGTILNSVNSNIAGVSVSEFNITDNHVGDYVLDFGANCVSGCSGGSSTMVANTDNGANTNNNASSDTVNNNTLGQVNNADVVNNMELLADSGNNSASFNTNGDSVIQTGDANVAANIINFVNSNIAGNVLFGVVNIFGNLVGDIILPDDPCSIGCSGSTKVANTGNGEGSTNTAGSSSDNNSSTFQANDATIENNLVFDANSGNNSTSFNTGGSSAVSTGSTSVDANVLNVANSNMSDGDYWWLVIVNEAGQWIGKIIGSPSGSTTGGSEGTQFVVDEFGQITAVNSGNGAGSENSASANTTNNSSTSQSNNANIVNNVNLTANTGSNTSSFNTGGDSNIVTGDATIVANIINFVNNNIVGDGKLVVTFVNVFGSWMGDFVGPGQKKDSQNNSPQQNVAQNNGVGGASISSNNNSRDNHSPASKVENGSNGPSVSNLSSDDNNTFIGSLRAGLGVVSTVATKVNVQHGDDAPEQKVAGVSTLSDSEENERLKINLAWIAVVMPALGMVYFIHKSLIKRLLINRA